MKTLKKWMIDRKCQTMRQLDIMKGCGCQKSSFCCSFSAIGCVLFVCRIIVFDVYTSIKKCWYVGFGDGMDSQPHCVGSRRGVRIVKQSTGWCKRFWLMAAALGWQTISEGVLVFRRGQKKAKCSILIVGRK